MIRSFACIVFGSILMVAASWWDNGQGDALGDGGLSAIKGRDIKKTTTNQSCEYATITVAGGEVLAGGGCAGKPDGTVCIQCRKDGKPLVGIIPDGGFWYPGSQVNGQVNCKDYIRKDGTCLNGGCQGLVVTGVCKDVLKDDVGPQPVPPG